jgi:hypothetical protein
MKKIVVLIAVFFTLAQMSVMAQATDVANVVFNAHLQSTFDLTVTGGGIQEITFATAADYNTGVFEGSGIVNGFSTITVEATGNWNLVILAPDFTPIVGTGTIPIDNLGVWLETTGAHTFGNEVTCAYTSAATSLGLATTDQEIIGLGTGNGGDASDNAFTLHWRMGTMDNASMHATSMFDQMANGDFTVGDYTTTAVMTLTEIP